MSVSVPASRLDIALDTCTRTHMHIPRRIPVDKTTVAHYTSRCREILLHRLLASREDTGKKSFLRRLWKRRPATPRCTGTAQHPVRGLRPGSRPVKGGAPFRAGGGSTDEYRALSLTPRGSEGSLRAGRPAFPRAAPRRFLGGIRAREARPSTPRDVRAECGKPSVTVARRGIFTPTPAPSRNPSILHTSHAVRSP